MLVIVVPGWRDVLRRGEELIPDPPKHRNTSSALTAFVGGFKRAVALEASYF